MYFVKLAGRALRLWFVRDADQHAAALAYFTPFALTPLIILSITIVGWFVGAERITAMLLRWGNTIDTGVTDLVYHSVQNFNQLSGLYYVPVIGTIFLSFMIFVTLNSLMLGFHKLWSVEERGFGTYLRRLWRILVFLIIFQIYLVAIVALSEVMSYLTMNFLWVGWNLISFVGAFLLTVLLLSVCYGLLSLKCPSFSGRFIGAVVAGLLLLFSRELVSFHFSTAPVQSLFGAAGLLITLLVWVYVAAGLILYGAAFAKVYDEDRLGK